MVRGAVRVLGMISDGAGYPDVEISTGNPDFRFYDAI